jgi:hypothetical protein
MVKIILAAITGLVLGGIAFFINYYDQILQIAQHRAGLLVVLQVNQAQDMYLLGGALLGTVISAVTTSEAIK